MNADPLVPPRPRAPVVPVLLGLLAALPFLGIFLYHPDGAYDLLALILAFAGGSYAGAALRPDLRRGLYLLECAVGWAMVVAAALSLWWSPFWLALGYGMHGAWGLAHRRMIRTELRGWFRPFSATFDFAAAALVIWYT